MSPGDVLVATRSVGKLCELRPLLEEAGYTVTDLDTCGLVEDADEEALERYDTFEENALAKARYFHKVSGGIAAIADDSGLEVLALGGRPGVRSKRWSGRPDLSGGELDRANNARLLEELADAPDRRARFVCAAAFVGRDCEVVRRGEAAGRILRAPRGTGGFGYDAYFESLDLGCTFGEASAAAKHRVSHRGRAVRSLLDALRAMEVPARLR